jgi:hypothetical protein
MKLNEFSKKPNPAKKQVEEGLGDVVNGVKNFVKGKVNPEKDDKKAYYDKALAADDKKLMKQHNTGMTPAVAEQVKEATGDPKFDGMMGNITGNTAPQTMGSAASNRVAAKSEMPPDAETINALNKMMFNLQKSMQTAEALLQRLTQGR